MNGSSFRMYIINLLHESKERKSVVTAGQARPFDGPNWPQTASGCIRQFFVNHVRIPLPSGSRYGTLL
jgi:hypothetical protein